jgi:hypothetical protein
VAAIGRSSAVSLAVLRRGWSQPAQVGWRPILGRLHDGRLCAPEARRRDRSSTVDPIYDGSDLELLAG